MSISLYCTAVVTKQEEIASLVPSRFVDSLGELAGSSPFTLKQEHVPALRALLAATRNGLYGVLLDMLREHTEITIEARR